MKSNLTRSFRLIACLLLLASSSVFAADLESSFRTPPPDARPWNYWFWINGNITREGITADLEAMARAGIGGVLIMEVARKDMAPFGGIAFGSPQWREMFKHVVAEARRLGLQVSMNNDGGWCGSGGPWITPELSMQKLIVTTSSVTGPARVTVALRTARLGKKKADTGFYRDIKVLACPDPPANTPVPRASILDITDKMDASGRLVWDAPAGQWKVLRIGCTSTGRTNHPSPAGGLGLECDKFNPDAIALHFNSLIKKLADDVGPDAGRVFTMTHIDSWESARRTGRRAWPRNSKSVAATNSPRGWSPYSRKQPSAAKSKPAASSGISCGRVRN